MSEANLSLDQIIDRQAQAAIQYLSAARLLTATKENGVHSLMMAVREIGERLALHSHDAAIAYFDAILAAQPKEVEKENQILMEVRDKYVSFKAGLDDKLEDWEKTELTDSLIAQALATAPGSAEEKEVVDRLGKACELLVVSKPYLSGGTYDERETAYYYMAPMVKVGELIEKAAQANRQILKQRGQGLLIQTVSTFIDQMSLAAPAPKAHEADSAILFIADNLTKFTDPGSEERQKLAALLPQILDKRTSGISMYALTFDPQITYVINALDPQKDAAAIHSLQTLYDNNERAIKQSREKAHRDEKTGFSPLRRFGKVLKKAFG